jgi:methionyl-tRNA formyltransferase
VRITIIGRTESLFNTALYLHELGHEIVSILTAKAAPEYTRTAEDFHLLAASLNVRCVESSKIHDHIDFLRESRADIAVSVNYTGVIPQSIIDLFPLGVLNAHGGDLPRYRGNACQAWALLNGENKVALCIHKMIGGELDSGDIVAREYLAIDVNTKISKILNWMTSRTPMLMLEAIRQIQQDNRYILEHQSKNPNDVLRCYPRRPEDGKINWSKSAADILRLINASHKPYSGAFCDFEGEKLTVWDAELLEDNEVFCAVPGQVTRIGVGFVEIACGTGKLKITLLERDGCIIPPSHFIKSIRSRLG